MADVILHNRPEGTPSDNEFVAYGTPTTPSGQIKMSNFYTLLMSKLGFFKVSNLFSEIFGNTSAMTSARANIGVYSTSEVQGLVTQRALKSNVIEKDSTVAFTPTIGTHPVNKQYVDDKNRFGTFNYGDIPTSGSTVFKTVTFTPPMNNTSYIVLIEQNWIYPEVIGPAIANKTVNSFEVGFFETVGGSGQTLNFNWEIKTMIK